MASCRSPSVRECFRTALCKVWKDRRHVVDPAAESLTRLTSIWVRPSFCAIVGMTWGSSLLASRPTSCSEGDLDSRYSLSPEKSIYAIYTATSIQMVAGSWITALKYTKNTQKDTNGKLVIEWQNLNLVFFYARERRERERLGFTITNHKITTIIKLTSTVWLALTFMYRIRKCLLRIQRYDYNILYCIVIQLHCIVLLKIIL